MSSYRICSIVQILRPKPYQCLQSLLSQTLNLTLHPKRLNPERTLGVSGAARLKEAACCSISVSAPSAVGEVTVRV